MLQYDLYFKIKIIILQMLIFCRLIFILLKMFYIFGYIFMTNIVQKLDYIIQYDLSCIATIQLFKISYGIVG